MVRLIFWVLPLLALGCASDPCPAPTGVWVLRFSERSGNCGALPNVNGTLLGPAADCAGEWTATDSSMCSYGLNRACSNGTSFRGTINYAGTDRWEGSVDVASSGAGGLPVCSSSYNLTVTRD